MGRARASGEPCEFVRDCLESVRILGQDAPFFEAVDTITEREVVLVRGKDRTITGIVTTADLSREYHQKAEPFLLLEEVEDRIRILIKSLNSVAHGDRESEGPGRRNEGDRGCERPDVRRVRSVVGVSEELGQAATGYRPEAVRQATERCP